MNITATSSYQGLFGYVSGGTIKNFTIKGKIIVSGTDTVQVAYVGGAVGHATNNTITQDVTSYVNLTDAKMIADSTKNHGKQDRIGGVVGSSADSSIKNCDYYGDITISCGDNCGGVVGVIEGSTSITYCNNYGNVTFTGDGHHISGVAGTLGKNTTMTCCANYGDITSNGNDCLGGVVAYSYQYNKIENCANIGTITYTGSDNGFVGGILGYINQASFLGVFNSFNYGNIVSNSTVNAGAIIGNYGKDAPATAGGSNNYYLKDSCIKAFGGTQTADTATEMTAAQFKCGEVAYELNNGVTDGTQVWYQNLYSNGNDMGEDYPSFSGKTVYYTRVGGCCDIAYKKAYRNTDYEHYNGEDISKTHGIVNGLRVELEDADTCKVCAYCKDCGDLVWQYEVTNKNMVYDGDSHPAVDFYSFTDYQGDYLGKDENLLEGTCVWGNVSVTTQAAATTDNANSRVVGWYTLKNVGTYQFTMKLVSRKYTSNDDGRWIISASTGISGEYSTDVEVLSPIDVTFKDYDGSVIKSETIDGKNVTEVTVPDLTIPSNEYYRYTFKYWYCEQTGEKYSSDDIPTFEELSLEGCTDVTFKAVYDLEYIKSFELVGSIDAKTDLSTSGIYKNGENVKIVNEGEGVTVYTNYKIATNDGVAALLLIPEYDKNFTVSAVSVNGQSVYAVGDISATSTEVLSGWKVTATGGTLTQNTTFKILLESLPVSTATGEETFIQIVYTMATAQTGEYNFGFVTKYLSDTNDNTTSDELSHNDRSEAYGVLSGDDKASLCEVKISVTDANIILVARKDAKIEIVNSSVVYDAEEVDISEDCVYVANHNGVTADEVKDAILYHYSAYDAVLPAFEGEHDWSQYVTFVWYDKDGNKLDSAPIEVGQYKVHVFAAENDFFKKTDLLIDFFITPYVIDTDVIKAESKTYNGEDQTWTKDDFTLDDVIAALNSDRGYGLEISNATYKNAGKYTVTLTLTASNNYTFDEKGLFASAGDTKTLEVEVTMNKFAFVIAAVNKESAYSDATKKLEYIYATGDFEENYAFVRTDLDNGDLKITLSTIVSSNSYGPKTYDITITISGNGVNNYDITPIHNQDKENNIDGNNGTYTVTTKKISVPTIDDLTYNGAEQLPVVKAMVNGKVPYTFSGDKQINAGEYKLIATLKDYCYEWDNATTLSDRRKIELNWKILTADLEITIGKGYTSVYSDELQPIEGKVSGELFGSDTLENIGITYIIDCENDKLGFLPVGEHTVLGNYAGAGDEGIKNYNVTIVNGLYTVTMRNAEATKDDLQAIIAEIVGAIKEYNGETIVWSTDTEGDFVINGSINGVEYSTIFALSESAAKTDAENYVNANGKLEDGVWTYWNPETKLYYTLTLSVKEEYQNRYMLYKGENGAVFAEEGVEVEVFIKQAKNEWRDVPYVDANNIENVEYGATAKFQAEGEVIIEFKDSEGTAVSVADFVKGEKYTACFTVIETNNYTGLYAEVVNFELEGYASVTIPTVYLDEENGDTVTPNGSITITYDGLTHKFVVVPENTVKYTIYISTEDNYASWKNVIAEDSNVSYQIVIMPTDNYQWTTGDRDAKFYSLIIKKAFLKITATSYDDVTFGDVIAEYEITADEFVNGETYADYGVNDIGEYFTCTYVAGDQQKGKIGTYPIAYNDGNEVLDSLHTLLSNYEVQVVDGEVVVSAFELDLSGLQGKLDEQDEQTWAEFIKGLSVEYNAKGHYISVLGLPDEIEATVSYENDTYPVDAGDYSIVVSFAIKGELNGVALNTDNYDWQDPSATVTLQVTKVHIKLTAYDQRIEWFGYSIYGVDTMDGEKKVEYLTSATDTSFIEKELYIGGVTCEGYYSLPDGQDEIEFKDILYVYYQVRENSGAKLENYDIESVSATLTIYRGTLTWEIELTTVNREFNYSELVVGSESSYADYFAKVKISNDYHERGNGELTYSFYTLNGDTYEEIDVPKYAGTYYVRAVYTNTIYKELDSGYKEIIISKRAVSVTATAQDVYYLQDVVYGYKSYTMSSIEQSVSFTFSKDGGKTWVYEPEDKWFMVGEYQVKAKINESANHQGTENIATFNVKQATLPSVTFNYNKDTATWEAITNTFENEDINKYGNVTVAYKIKGYEDKDWITDYTFKAPNTGVYTLVASVENNDNFKDSESDMVEVFSVSFYDDYEHHELNPFPAYDFSKIAPTQLRFKGQYATQPDCCSGDAEAITIEGYTFAKKWELSTDESVYDFTKQPVTESITLLALWNINTYTVTWMNDNNEIYKDTYNYLDTPKYNEENYGKPVRATTDEYIFTFCGWGLSIDGEIVALEDVQIKDDIKYFAVYTKEGVAYKIIFMVSEDGGEYKEYKTKEAVKFGATLTMAYNLDNVMWFRADVWYADEARTQLITTMPVAKEGITVYGAYVFDIGNGDVNADGEITTDDITIYREYIVGGYKMTVVESGTEWTLVTVKGFNASERYFIKRVADVNADTSDDIRDITTVRMAIVKGYGYEIASGVKMAKVSGEAVRTIYIAPKVELNYAFSEGEDVTLVEQDGKVITVDTTHPPKEDVGDGGVSLPKGSNNVLNIAVSGIDTEYLASGAMPTVNVALYKGEVSEANKYDCIQFITPTAVDDNGNFTVSLETTYTLEDRTYIMTIDVTYQGVTYLQSEFTVTFYTPLTYTFSESQQIGVSSVYEVEISEDGKTITIDKNSVKERYAVNAYKGLFNVNIDLGRNLGDGTTEENATVVMTLTTKKKMSEGVNISYGRWGERDGVSGGWIYDDYTYETAEDGGVSFDVDFAVVEHTIDSDEYTLSITVSYGNFTWETAEYTLILENF